MHAPVRLLAGAWPAPVERAAARFVWQDPRAVLDEDISPEAFSRAMAAFTVGSTIKITGSGRHRDADRLALEHVDLDGAVIVDLGASDATTSVEFVEQLDAAGRSFAQFVIADLYLDALAVTVGAHTVLFEESGQPIVVSGRRFLGWPSGSRAVSALYAPVLRQARARLATNDPRFVHRVPLLNPRARALLRDDPRVGVQRHDVFTTWPGPAPDLIKVANLLRLLYFPPERISAALRALLAGLPEGGHLLLVENPRITPAPPVRAGLYRRENGRFVPVAQTPVAIETAHLVPAVTLDGVPGPVLTSGAGGPS